MGWDELEHPLMKYSRWIVLEGCDGSGTTTQQRLLAGKIFDKDKRYSVSMTREPSGGVIGQFIREILTKHTVVNNQETILALWQADRYEHLPRDTLPVLQGGGIVIQDRFWYSTICYQATQGIGADRIIAAHKPLPVPDCVLIYDLSSWAAEQRRKKREESPELFDDSSTQSKVIDTYKELPNIVPKELHPKFGFHMINASGSIDDVLAEAWKVIEPILPYNNVPMFSPR
jgi:dTMP kinase